MPRSSIAAVVLRRAELGLTDEQVVEMEQIDRKREEQDAAARDEVEKERKQAASGRPAGAGSSPAGSPGTRGGGMGGGMRGGGMHRGRMGGGMPAASTGVKKTDRPADLEDRLDENDTKAYLDAETVLTETQKDRARDIASEYREQLYEQRELARSKASSK